MNQKDALVPKMEGQSINSREEMLEYIKKFFKYNKKKGVYTFKVLVELSPLTQKAVDDNSYEDFVHGMNLFFWNVVQEWKAIKIKTKKAKK